MITEKHLMDITCTTTSGKWAPYLDAAMKKFGIYTKLRASHFIAQCAHESGGFRLVRENMNYSVAGLRGVFSKYFIDEATAVLYARHPEAIGSRVYANRMGNGDEASKEGYKFRGRGLIQCTGKNNYTACSQFLYGDDRLLTNPELLESMDGAVSSACWFWMSNGLNKYADKDDVLTLTRRINGGTNGLDDRKKYLSRCKDVFNEKDF